MSFDLCDELARATREYRDFEYGLDGNEAAARAFRARLARLAMIGAPALDALERQLLHDSDHAARNAAARVLSSMPIPDAAGRMLAAFLRHDLPPVCEGHLVRLGKAGSLPPSMFPSLDQVRPFERGALVRALFRRRSPKAENLIEPIFTGFESVLAEAAIDGMAMWGDPSLLRDVMARPPMKAPKSLPRFVHPLDVRPHAAYYLALTGDPAALDALRAWSHERSQSRAAQAVMRLAWLAHPDGVAPTAKLLRESRGEALEFALGAAGTYKSPALTPDLVRLVERAGPRGPIPESGTIPAEALVSLSWLSEDPTEEPTLERVRPLAMALDPARRFDRGVPLTLAVLAEDLTSRHSGPRSEAAHNLRAITGEDHGFDLDDDLAGNLAAIDAWRERARDPAPMGDGGWAFLGRPLPPPPLPP